MLVKLELWESEIVFNNNFWSATYLMPTLRFGKVWQVIRHFGVLFLQFRYP